MCLFRLFFVRGVLFVFCFVFGVGVSGFGFVGVRPCISIPFIFSRQFIVATFPCDVVQTHSLQVIGQLLHLKKTALFATRKVNNTSRGSNLRPSTLMLLRSTTCTNARSDQYFVDKAFPCL